MFQADTDAADKKRKRTFRKYTYRGVDLDQLLDMSRYNFAYWVILHFSDDLIIVYQ